MLRNYIFLLSVYCSFSAHSQIVVHYDAGGNRVDKITKSYTTPLFVSSVRGLTYQWQQNDGSGFKNLVNGPIFSGATSIALSLHQPPTLWDGYQFRCIVNTGSGNVTTPPDTLHFNAQWIGRQNTIWQNAANWGCEILPDSNTHVTITGGADFYPILTAPVKVLTLKLDSLARLIVGTGADLWIRK